MHSRFAQEYARLDPAQKKAVDTLYGPLMVLAGPGTGKTHVIVLRIANILQKTDTRPEEILAITFTEAGAREMKKRLVDLIGQDAHRVRVSTFHGFCNEIIGEYPEYMPFPPGSRPIEEIEQLQLLERAVDAVPLEVLRPYGNPYFYVPHMRTKIQKLKQEAVTPGRFLAYVRAEEKKLGKKDRLHASGSHKGKEKASILEEEQRLRKSAELAAVYAEYEKLLRAGKAYDFSDMLLCVLEALKKHRVLLRILQERFQFIIVDEHQDTNNAQQLCIELLSKGVLEPNICVVGDEKQAIYRFQGGSMENFLFFRKEFPSAAMITLGKNFRSSQNILDAVRELGNRISPRNSHLQGQGSGKNIRICACPSVRAELLFVAHEIKKKICEGTDPGHIAVLYRDNADAKALKEILESERIPHSFESDQNAWEDPYVRNMVRVCAAVAEPGNERKMIEALHADFFDIPPYELYAWLSGEEAKRMSLFGFCGMKENGSAPVCRAVRVLQRAAVEDANRGLSHAFEYALEQTGCLARILSDPDMPVRMRNMRALFEFAKSVEERNPDAGMREFLDAVMRAKEHRMQLRAGAEETAERPGVRCMTAHKAKGREFPVVYLVHAYDGHWGNRRTRDMLPFPPGIFSLSKKKHADENEEDEMRLMYVACTRAKDELVITFPESSHTGKAVLPSEFIDAFPDAVVSRMSGVLYGKGSENIPVKEAPVPEDERMLFKDLFFKKGLSVTDLNNFTECAWKYVYMNLLRLPHEKEKWEKFGTATHAALRDFFSEYAKTSASKERLLALFEIRLSEQPMRERVREELREKGIRALESYYDLHAGSWHRDYLLEFPLRDIDAGLGILLKGVLDKMEIFEGNRVRVIDFKTGHPKTRNEIEGKTKDSKGSIHRQLVFYAILLRAFKKGMYRMDEGEIQFIEAEKGNRNASHAFVIGDEDVDRVREEIRTMADAFEKGTYGSFACGEKECEFCRLRAETERSRSGT